jgi:ribosomal protein L11 methyltransferase
MYSGKWLELKVSVSPELVEPVAELFSKQGRGLVIDESEPGHVTVATYLPETSRKKRVRIEVGIRLLNLIAPLGSLQACGVEKKDWENAWKAHFTTLRVGEHLVIVPSWIEYELRDGEVPIRLDPGMAFGTGYHPTTRLCLEYLEGCVSPGMKVIDVGTGSGILAIAAAKLGASQVVALDTDATAVRGAKRNLRENGVQKYVMVYRATLPHQSSPSGAFELATANITSKVIIQLAQELHSVLKLGGLLIVSGLIDSQVAETMKRLRGVGFTALSHRSDGDWVALLLRR